MFNADPGDSEIMSYSICDSSCRHLLHYFARAGGVSAEILTVLSEKHNIVDGQVGVILKRTELIQALELIIAKIRTSTAHRHRYMKLESYLATVINKTTNDEMFYVHRCD
ncbi:hypothetical protein OQJ65_17135 [Vibrio sp. Sgm 22]|uniref:hypothetical protein n=1 Tax=unclassified Vibrio TaxID=2614977 RepID=UPI002248945B|nr:MULTISPECIES: hypothetical protein [unclassified Vibrio]MCX2760060.1 hypothetical protein [Vibrio sp. 14G-20]MCX2777048.1 hypothetical protein [Vibrio sp. Sgm 22]